MWLFFHCLFRIGPRTVISAIPFHVGVDIFPRLHLIACLFPDHQTLLRATSGPIAPVPSSELAALDSTFRYHFLLPPTPTPEARLVTFNVDHVWDCPDIVDFFHQVFLSYGKVYAIRPFYWKSTTIPSRL